MCTIRWLLEKQQIYKLTSFHFAPRCDPVLLPLENSRAQVHLLSLARASAVQQCIKSSTLNRRRGKNDSSLNSMYGILQFLAYRRMCYLLVIPALFFS